MFLFRYILLSALLFTAKTYGQQPGIPGNLVGKTFVSRNLEYLEILSDTSLYSSINSYKDTAIYFLRNDTLFVKQRYLMTDQTGTKYVDDIYNYKITGLSADTIQLKNNFRSNYKPANWEDTLFFVNIERLKEEVAGFKYISLNYSSPWSGTRHITIDSLGEVNFNDNPIPYSINNPGADKNAKPKGLTGYLTRGEFINFKNLLSKSLPSKLPFKRSCPMDGATSNFELVIGEKRFLSTGCDLSWTHTFLLSYIYNIDQNKGLLKKKHSINGK